MSTWASSPTLMECQRITVRGVTVRHFNGDGMIWEISHDVRVEGCHFQDIAMRSLHPGSGPQRPIIRGNKIDGNTIGIYFCWGVRGGLVEKNTIEDSKSFGVSIGHRDTDNTVRDNDILRSGKVGVLLRLDEEGPAFAPHRNKVEKNRIIDSDGIAIDVQGVPAGVVIADNNIRETRQSKASIGIRIAASSGPVQLGANQIDGYATQVLDLRSSQRGRT